MKKDMTDKMNVCVFCASSSQIDKSYMDDAFKLGTVMATNDMRLVYGGGAKGLMGAVCDGLKKSGGEAVGVIPHFMVEKGWLREGLDEVIEVDTMSTRKQRMEEMSDACVALPGGVGTFDELMEVVSLKKLGLYINPIVIMNTNGFYDHLLSQLDKSIEDGFMDQRHGKIWRVASTPEEVIEIVHSEPCMITPEI